MVLLLGVRCRLGAGVDIVHGVSAGGGVGRVFGDLVGDA